MPSGATIRSGQRISPASSATAALMAATSSISRTPLNRAPAIQPAPRQDRSTPAQQPSVDSSRCAWPVPRISCTTKTAIIPRAMKRGRPVQVTRGRDEAAATAEPRPGRPITAARVFLAGMPRKCGQPMPTARRNEHGDGERGPPESRSRRWPRARPVRPGRTTPMLHDFSVRPAAVNAHPEPGPGVPFGLCTRIAATSSWLCRDRQGCVPPDGFNPALCDRHMS